MLSSRIMLKYRASLKQAELVEHVRRTQGSAPASTVAMRIKAGLDPGIEFGCRGSPQLTPNSRSIGSQGSKAGQASHGKWSSGKTAKVNVPKGRPPKGAALV